MAQDQIIVRTKVGLLELAKQLGNVSQTCKIMGYSRDSFCRLQMLDEKGQGFDAAIPLFLLTSPAAAGAAH